ncbi:MAG: carbohydrate-binding protein [Lachnospiraceae bacterium]|nr:carbohydrate-binding protein [Lachnospiraceae bacterium]
MKRKSLFTKIVCAVSAFALTLSFAPAVAEADNPFVQTFYTSDPAPFVGSDNVLYAITDHDEDITEGGFFTMREWRAYSTTDMVNWRDHGVILKLEDVSWANMNDRRAWAPQAVEKDGKYYMYFPSTSSVGGYFAIGVAVSDSPTGPYRDALGKPLVIGGGRDIDPTVYIDDDGQAYLYWCQSPIKYVKLNDDMISYSGNIVEQDPGSVGLEGYVEGPWFTARTNDNGEKLYYMVYAGHGNAGEAMRYATSTSPTGPWTHHGSVMEMESISAVEDNGGHGSFTIHGGVVDYKGKSFMFYHNGALAGGGGYHRSACIEEFEYDADGKIPVMRMSLNGANAVDTLNPYQQIEAETICWEYGVKTVEEPKEEGPQGVTVYNMHDNDYIKLESVDFGEAGAIKFTAAVKDVKADANASIEVYIMDENCVDNDKNPMNIFNLLTEGDKVATVDVDNTTDEYKEFTVDLDKKVTGVHDLFLVFKGDYAKPASEMDPASVISETDTGMFKFDYWKFTEEVVATPAPTPTVQPSAQPDTNQPTVTPAPTDNKLDKAIIKSAKNLKGKKIKVAIKKMSDVDGYEVVIAKKKNFKGKQVINTKKVKVKIKKFKKAKLKKSKKYFVKARAYKIGADGNKIYGDYSAAKKIKIKK